MLARGHAVRGEGAVVAHRTKRLLIQQHFSPRRRLANLQHCHLRQRLHLEFEANFRALLDVGGLRRQSRSNPSFATRTLTLPSVGIRN